MTHPELTLTERRFGKTTRRDAWWLQPLAVFIGLTTFGIYTAWASFQNAHYTFGPYLSPFYAPELFGSSEHSWFGDKPGWWPLWLPFSPAFFILWAPLGFRLTCYYYRGAYYKAFWADPPSCTIGEPRKAYRGENSFPLIIQNVHRYFLYFAILFLFFLSYEAWKGFWFKDDSGVTTFGIGIGSLLLVGNVIFLGGYTLGCHSLRHLAGGFLDRLSSAPVRRSAYDCVSCLNRRHMLWAWMSLCWVGLSDIYIRLCSMGILIDWRII